MSRQDAASGLAHALPRLLEAISNNCRTGDVAGMVEFSCRTESNGTVRMLLQGECRITGCDAKTITDDFSRSAMSGMWRFPPAEGPSLVTAHIVIERP
jgi:hypothetical protein